MHKLIYTDKAKENLVKLKKQGQFEKLKKIKQTLEKISDNPRYSGLHTHKYKGIKGYNGEDVFQSYVENRTSGAFRIFWHYGPEERVITIAAITPHP